MEQPQRPRMDAVIIDGPLDERGMRALELALAITAIAVAALLSVVH